jgi:DNA-binding Lrp family transcriptional regulator
LSGVFYARAEAISLKSLRQSITEFSKHAGLSIPATNDWLRKLEDSGASRAIAPS